MLTLKAKRDRAIAILSIGLPSRMVPPRRPLRLYTHPKIRAAMLRAEKYKDREPKSPEKAECRVVARVRLNKLRDFGGITMAVYAERRPKMGKWMLEDRDESHERILRNLEEVLQ